MSRMTSGVLSAAVVLLALLPANPAADGVLFEESFDSRGSDSSLPKLWWAEGSKAVRLQDGRLLQDANPDDSGEDMANSVVWLNREFSGDIRLECDVHVNSAKGDVNDAVIFFLFSDPSGTPLHDTRASRASGKQSLYTDGMNGYVLFYWGKGGVTKPANIRLRDCPGAHLLLEEDAYEIETGKTYRLVVERVGSSLRLYSDGRKLADHDLSADEVANPIHSKGLIGFKTWNTELWWDNIKVTRVGGAAGI
jgi:hypothetical protein